MKNKTTLVITVLLVVLLGVYIYKDLNKNSEEIDTSGEISQEDAFQILKDSGVELEGDSSNYKIEQVPVDEYETQIPQPIPNLDKKITNNSSMPNDAVVLIENKITELKSHLKENPGDFYSWISLGINAKTLEDYNKTIEYWEYAIRLSPDNKVTYNNLGDLYHYHVKDFKKSEEYFLKALEIDPSYIFTYRSLHELYKYSYQQDTNKAENILLQGLRLFPEDLNLLVPLAVYYKETGDIENAEIYYKKASDIAKRNGDNDLFSELQKELLLLNKSN